ncbi:MAG: Fic family protein [Candidatus Altiarchaeota archaeon]
MDVSLGEIITINKELGGDLVRGGSIDFALSAGRGKSLYTRIALLWRAIIVDHPFTDINKRTAFNIAVLMLKRNHIKADDDVKDRLAKELLKVAKQNINEIKKIERRIRYAVEGN